jgi:Macrocin-O-methyltransferase (TylF)
MASAVDRSGSPFNSNKLQTQWAGLLSVNVQSVLENFDRLGLLDPGNVGYLEGFIQDTLPNWTEALQISLLRVDVDIYSATYDALHFLYPRISKGGAVLFDDWKFVYSRQAIRNYRKEHGITHPVQFLNGTFDPMAYWIKED